MVVAYKAHNLSGGVRISLPQQLFLMGWWRNRLAQESYTFKVVGSSPAHPTFLLGSGYALVCTPDCHSGDQVGSNPIGPAINLIILGYRISG